MSGGTGSATWAPVGLLRAIWRYRAFVVASTALASLAGFYGSTLFSARYEATSSLQLEDPDEGGVFGELREGVEGEAYLLDEAQRITSTPVLRRAAQQLTYSPTVAELRKQVEGAAVIELNSVRVTASATTPRRAVEIADAVAVAYQDASSDLRRERAGVATTALQSYIGQLNIEIQAADLALDERRSAAVRLARAEPVPTTVISQAVAVAEILAGDLEYQTLLLERQAIFSQVRSATDKIERILIDAEVVGSGVRRFDQAEMPGAPAWPQRRLFAASLGLLGLLGASGVAWRLAEDRAAAERSEDAASSVGVPLLGDIPRFRSPARLPGMNVSSAVSRARTIAAPYSDAGESFQYTLSSLLARLDAGTRSHVVVVAGTVRGDGGTTTALNLAFAASHRQMRVVVIDADFRRRGLTRLCGLSAEKGISESDGSRLASFDIARQGRLNVIPTGNAFGDAIAYLNSGEFSLAVEAARRAHDLVILDAPPILTAADALSAAEGADAVVLVVGLGRTFDDLGEAARVLGQAPAPLVGCVFNRPKRRWLFGARGRR